MSVDMILSLASSMQEKKAYNVHMVMNNIKHTKGITAVVSVYDNEKPCHKVLDELYEWCKENDNQEMIDKIHELEKDMSWNDENPV